MDLIAKTRDDYNRIAPYFSGTRYALWPELKQCKQYLTNGQRILDWGCGNGRLTSLFESHREIEYYGVDQSEELLKIAAREHPYQASFGTVSFISTADAASNFAPDFFDLIFLIASFHHLPDEASRLSVLKKMYTELKTGGRIIMTVWNLDSDWADNKKKQDWKQMGERDFLIPWKNPNGEVLCDRYYHSFEKQELRALIEQAGFVITTMEYGDGEWTDSKEGRNLMCVAQKI